MFISTRSIYSALVSDATPARTSRIAPRIIATANTMQGDREKCLPAGMDDHVTKPIRVDALVEALNQANARKET